MTNENNKNNANNCDNSTSSQKSLKRKISTEEPEKSTKKGKFCKLDDNNKAPVDEICPTPKIVSFFLRQFTVTKRFNCLYNFCFHKT